jgi:hypothetical protein
MTGLGMAAAWAAWCRAERLVAGKNWIDPADSRIALAKGWNYRSVVRQRLLPKKIRTLPQRSRATTALPLPSPLPLLRVQNRSTTGWGRGVYRIDFLIDNGTRSMPSLHSSTDLYGFSLPAWDEKLKVAGVEGHRLASATKMWTDSTENFPTPPPTSMRNLAAGNAGERADRRFNSKLTSVRSHPGLTNLAQEPRLWNRV